ncbi:MAG: PLP-dependent transferase [Myxococcales bacterium]|nr:PLP-dependent transferase [Myxococcales bacterium]
MATPKLHFETLAIHAGQEPDPNTGAVMQPIVLSTTFSQDGPGAHKGYEYTRSDNPNRRSLEICLASLEGASHGLAFSSGCAAISTVMQLLSPGDHVVACDDVYGGTRRLFDQVFSPLGLKISWVDLADASALSNTLQDNTRLVWIETPTNPMLKLLDIRALSQTCAAAKIPLAVDNTFATPMLQRPLELGASLVVHSMTKYLNGHSDVLGGAVLTNDDELAQRLRFLQNAVGAVPSPFDCFMVLRGLKTLPVRMHQHCVSAKHLSRWLSDHPGVKRVIYPGLQSHPQHALAQQQMLDFGGIISFEVEGGRAAAVALLKSVRIFTCAESLGGVESLIELPVMMTHASVPEDVRQELGISAGLIRISVGLENVEDLQNDLNFGLNAA